MSLNLHLRSLSITGVVFASLYLAFTAFFVAKSEYCFHSDGMFCLIGYMIPALPWVLIFMIVESIFGLESNSTFWSVAFYSAVMVSVLINTVSIYRLGRFFANQVLRKTSSST